jgi:hypothetical protein
MEAANFSAFVGLSRSYFRLLTGESQQPVDKLNFGDGMMMRTMAPGHIPRGAIGAGCRGKAAPRFSIICGVNRLSTAKVR